MFRLFVILAVATAFTIVTAHAREVSRQSIPTEQAPSIGPFDSSLPLEARFALAATNTTILYSQSFDTGGTCTEAGWTKVDMSSANGLFWHVDDMVGANIGPDDSLFVLAGSRSLWCGVRKGAGGLGCGYLAGPGYGNGWRQSWRTKTCIAVTGPLNVNMLLAYECEPGFDALFLEYTTDCTSPFTGWVVLDGGIPTWSGKSDRPPGDGVLNIANSYAVGGASSVKVRLRFTSDGAYSDEDALLPTSRGAVIIDNLQVEGLASEDFEGETVGATSSNDWEAFQEPGYGQYFALFSGSTQLQQGDACTKNPSCLWAAINGSTETYACGGFPLQPAVPKGNAEGLYINNAIESPAIPLVGSGSAINYVFSVYRDMPLNALVFNVWDVTSIDALGCQAGWRSRGFVYYGNDKDWIRSTFPVGDLIPATAVSMRVRLGVVDMCGAWCGIYGTGSCHSHAPLFDNVKVYRVDLFGPVYSTRDIDMFQDTFPSDGTDTGFARADCAQSIIPNTSPSPTVQPGDSCFFNVIDPLVATGANPSGLMDDGAGKAVYCWTRVVGDDAKTNALVSTYGGKDIQVADGKIWARMQATTIDADIGRFSIDLPDDVLFAGGDVVEFFFGATNTNDETTYCAGSALNYVQNDVDLAAETASEFSILPVNGNGTGIPLLYVDGMDGRGAQVYWDTAFEQMGLNPDRYDVRGPSSAVGNRPGSRVRDVDAQLNANYRMIVWDCGDLSVTLGDFGVNPVLLDKSQDFGMLNNFLGGLTSNGGVYICGDDFPQRLNSSSSAASVTFKTSWITYTLTTGNHRPTYGNIAPAGIGTAGGPFAGDTWVIYGGCPIINDFDVMAPTGSTAMHSSYNAAAANNGAEIGKITSPTGSGGTAKVMIAGYSFIYIRDDEADGTRDASKHLFAVIQWLGDLPGQPTDTKPAGVNHLAQNYPNPFNPQTTIAFSIRERGHVTISIYNVAGQHLKTVLDESRAAGSYTDVRWDGTDAAGSPVASGVYLYRLVAGDFSATRKLVLLK
jgi:hypothetical protein